MQVNNLKQKGKTVSKRKKQQIQSKRTFSCIPEQCVLSKQQRTMVHYCMQHFMLIGEWEPAYEALKEW